MAAQSTTAQTVIELRQYRMKPGRRDELIDLFEREFVESQEAHGMSLLGQFRDLDAPGHFVWMRGFESMTARKAALEGFYGGPIWQAHREAANATLADNDDVLLLKPPVAAARFDLAPRPPAGTDPGPAALVVVTIQALDAPPAPDFADRFETEVRPALEAADASVLGWMITEAAENTFPGLPVREGEQILAWVGRFADVQAHADHLVNAEQAGLGDGFGSVSRRGVIQRLRLAPTDRSRLR
jgi:quinol monooxygenase YgiN